MPVREISITLGPETSPTGPRGNLFSYHPHGPRTTTRTRGVQEEPTTPGVLFEPCVPLESARGGTDDGGGRLRGGWLGRMRRRRDVEDKEGLLFEYERRTGDQVRGSKVLGLREHRTPCHL